MANTFVFDDDEPQPELGGPAPDQNDPEQPEEGEGNNRTFMIAAVSLGVIVLLALVCMAVYALLFLPKQRAAAQMTEQANQAAIAQATSVQMETEAAALFTPTLAPSETPTPQPSETVVVVFASPTASVAPSSEPATATFEAMLTQVAVIQLTSGATSVTGLSAGTPVGVGTKAVVANTLAPGKTSAAPLIPGPARTAIAQGTPATAVISGPAQTAVAQGTALGYLVNQELAQTGFADEFGLPGLFVISLILVVVILLARRLRQSPMAH